MLLLYLYLRAVLCVGLTFVSKDLFILFYNRRALRLKLILWRSRHNLGGMARYTAQAATCKRLIKKYRLNTERRLLASNNVSAFYKHIYNIISSSQDSVSIRSEDDIILQDDASEARAINAYFAFVFNDNINGTLPSVRRNDRIVSADVDFSPEIVFDALQSVKRS